MDLFLRSEWRGHFKNKVIFILYNITNKLQMIQTNKIDVWVDIYFLTNFQRNYFEYQDIVNLHSCSKFYFSPIFYMPLTIQFSICHWLYNFLYVIDYTIFNMPLTIQFSICHWLYNFLYVIDYTIFYMPLTIQFSICHWLYNFLYAIDYTIFYMSLTIQFFVTLLTMKFGTENKSLVNCIICC
jgi:hypothetical protein